MSLEEQKLLTLPVHLESSPVSSEVCIAQSIVFFCVVFCEQLFIFLFWPLYCLSLCRFTASDYLLMCLQAFLSQHLHLLCILRLSIKRNYHWLLKILELWLANVASIEILYAGELLICVAEYCLLFIPEITSRSYFLLFPINISIT